MVRFSVIVPIYNIDEFLPQCIESILSQSFHDFEVILVNDGSTDQSGTICEKYADMSKRIRIIHKSNGGLSDARNRGLKEAGGEYIIFVDGDDYIEENALEKIDKSIRRNNEPDIVITRIKEIFPNGNVRYTDLNMPKEEAVSKELAIIWNFCKSNKTWPAPKYVVNSSLIKKHSLKFAKNFLHEDIEWTSRLFLYAESIINLDFYWYNHRQKRRGSITNQINSKSIMDTIILVSKNISSNEYNNLDETSRKIIFKRMVKSVFFKMRYYNNLTPEEKQEVVCLLDRNKFIFEYVEKTSHRIFLLFCKLLGFERGLSILKLRP